MAQYENLEIRIRKDDVSFQVQGADYRGNPNFTQAVLDHLADLRNQTSPEDYGEELQAAAFKDDAHYGFYHLRKAIDSGQRFRVCLNVDIKATELHQLRWECLCDTKDPPLILSCGRYTPVSRYLPLGASRREVTAEKLRVLIVISNPVDLGQRGGKWPNHPRLDEQGEAGVIADVLDDLHDRVEYDFQTKPASLEMIRARLYNDDFHVLHVVGHGGFVGEKGKEKGYLLLETEDEKTDAVGETRLAKMVRRLPELRLVVLAACYSGERSEADAFVGLAPRMIEAGVPAVIAMQEKVTVETARLFTESFYGALLKSRQTLWMVDAAVNAARDRLWAHYEYEEGSWDWTIPALFMRGDGKLFEPAPVGAARDAATSRVVERTQQTEAWLPQLSEVGARLIPEVARLPEQELYRLQERLVRGPGPAPERSLWQELGVAKSQAAQYQVPSSRKGFDR